MRKSLVAVCVLFALSSSGVFAAGTPHRYQLVLPCFPMAAWMAMIRGTTLKPIDTRVDNDGDTWVIWQAAGGVWRSTLTVSHGQMVCVLAGNGRIPAGTAA